MFSESVSFGFAADCLSGLQELIQSASISCNSGFLAQRLGKSSRRFLTLICQLGFYVTKCSSSACIMLCIYLPDIFS